MFQVPLHDDEPRSAERVLTLREGTRIGGRFRLGALLDRAPEQAVFDATDEELGRTVRLRLRASPSERDPRLLHPGVAHYVDHGCVGAWFAAVLDPGEGEPLAWVLRHHPDDQVDLGTVMAFGVDLLQALDHAHAHGLHHGNLGVHSLHAGHEHGASEFVDTARQTTDWTARIVDFPEADARPLLPDEAVPFASPERLGGSSGDARSDVYAVGALLYTLATGAPPFGVVLHQAREAHLYQALPSHVALPDPIYAVLVRAMSKRPEHRFATAGALAAALLDAWDAVIADDAPIPAPLHVGQVRRDALDSEPDRDDATDVDSLEPAPFRRFEPSADLSANPAWDERSASPVLPALLLAVICVLFAGSAGAAGLAAGGLWWATSYGPLAPELAVAAAEPVLTLPSTTRTSVADPLPTLADGATQAADHVRVAHELTAAPEGMRVPVTFGYDSYAATPDDGFSAFARDARSRERVRLTGHTDDRGSEEANRLMGLGRAWSVSMLLAAQGVDQVELASAGEAEPEASNATPEGRAANRRVTAEFPTNKRVADLLVPLELN